MTKFKGLILSRKNDELADSDSDLPSWTQRGSYGGHTAFPSANEGHDKNSDLIYRQDEEESDKDDDDSSQAPIMDLTTSMDPNQSKSRSNSTSRSHYYQNNAGTHMTGVDGTGQPEHLRSSLEHQEQQPLKSPTKSTPFRYDNSGGGWEHASARPVQSILPQTSNQGMISSMPSLPVSSSPLPPPSSSTLTPSLSLNSPGSTSSCSLSMGTDNGLTLAQMRKRKRRPQPIPEDCKDDAYWERRKRNNESAKRSREMRRMKEQQTTMRVIYLEQDNLRLKTEVDMLRTELEKLREILYNRNSNFH